MSINNPHLLSRLAKQTDPAELMQIFENFERMFVQSANTRDGKRAEPPKRAPLSRELTPA